MVPASEDINQKRRTGQIYDALDSVDSPNFFLWVTVDAGGPDSPPTAALLRDVTAWLSTLDPDQVAALYDAEGGFGGAVPSHNWELGGWQITFRPIPKRKEARGKPGIRPLGAYGPGQASLVDDPGAFRQALQRKKPAQYGDFRLPYVVALLSTRITAHSSSIASALLGTEAVEIRTRADGTHESEWVRKPDGFWTSSKNTTVSAVLVAETLFPWRVATVTPRIWLNPWAGLPLAETRPWAAAKPDVAKGEMVFDDALLPIHTQFGLAADWPGPEDLEQDDS